MSVYEGREWVVVDVSFEERELETSVKYMPTYMRPLRFVAATAAFNQTSEAPADLLPWGKEGAT